MAAAQAFFRSAKAATGVTPERVTTDGHGSYPRAITLGPAAIVAVAPGAPTAIRDALQLRLEPKPGDWGAALDYLTANARVIAAIFLAAWARSRSGPLGPVLDALVALVIVGNTALVGAAIGAYGPPLLPWLVHLPVEWAAMTIAGVAFVRARAGDRLRRPLRVAISTATLALVVAAIAESFATPGGYAGVPPWTGMVGQ